MTGTSSVQAAYHADSIDRILVKGVNWVGDAVMATPALSLLRRRFPNAHITLMVRPWVAAVYENNPDVNDLWVHDESSSGGAFLRAVRKVRYDRYALGVALPNSIRSALLLWMGGVPRRIGYRFAGRGWMLNYGVAPDRNRRHEEHEVYYYLRLLEPLCGKPEGPVRLTLRSGKLECEEVELLLSRRHMAPRDRVIGLAPGSINSNAKRWPAERFAALADRIQEQWDAQIVLIGSQGEREAMDRVEAACRNREGVHNLAGQLSLGQVIALIGRLTALVCNDSGAMHMGAALGTPTVAIFGPTNWTTTFPFSHAARVLRAEGINCAPCMLRECPIDHRCMTEVTPEMALAALKEMVEKRARNSSEPMA